jgi:peptidoglycan L-alanyl-D-glutamate endopeptidase CwlK
MAFKLSPASEKILATVRPDLQKVIRRAAELTTVPFAVVSGNRTQKQQDYLYAQGRTRPGMVITWTRNSNHIGGAAIDFSAVDTKGNPTNHLKHTWNAGYYKPIADAILAAGKECGIPVEWPLWKKGDWGHIQLAKPYQKLFTAPTLTSTEKLKADQGPILKLTTPDVVAKSTKGTRYSVVTHRQPSRGVTLPQDGRKEQKGYGDLSKPLAAVEFLINLGWEKHQAAALVANGVWESGGKDHIHTTALGDGGTAHGGFQWRGDRYSGPNGLLTFTMTHCPGHSSSEPFVQLRYAHWELTEGNEKRAGRLIKEAKTLEEANKGAISYLRPVHFTWEAPEKGHGFQRRLEIAQWIMGQRKSPR